MNTLTGIWLVSLLVSVGDADLKVMTPENGVAQASETLPTYLKGLAREAFARRRERYEQLKTEEQCVDYARSVREFFQRQIGPLPERQPLNPQVVGKLEGQGFHAEKIIFESRPNHHVTAAFYVPDGTPPFPGVLIASGHSKNGKAAEYNQRMCILLAKNGIAALCFDPIGQGERGQLLRPDHQQKYGSTTEHTLIGIGAIPLGWNTATFRIYDGMRCLDYLASRPEVDPKRIGCTGCSGGGTMTSYLMSLDDRVFCAAPACYVTTLERLIETIGPQDAEQNIAGQIGFGMEQTDYVLMRAPKPTLICSTTRDFFDIGGSWDTFRQAKRFYARLGFPERVDLVEDDFEHGVTKLNRGTLTHWMRRWMLGNDDHVSEPDFPVFSDAQLTCTPQGQVMLLAGEKSVFDLNAERADALSAKRTEYWSKAAPDEARNEIRARAGIAHLKELPAVEAKSVGSAAVSGAAVEKLLLTVAPGLQIPALVFTPDSPKATVLYCDQEGMQKGASAGGKIAAIVAEGNRVLAVDLPGIGETNPGGADAVYGEWKNAFLAYLLGKPLVAIQAESLLQCARHLSERNDGKPIHLIASGMCGVPALHAAALEPQLFEAVKIRQCVASWDLVARTAEPKDQLGCVVHNSLEVYDLPDLVKLSGEKKITLDDPRDAKGQPLRQ